MDEDPRIVQVFSKSAGGLAVFGHEVIIKRAVSWTRHPRIELSEELSFILACGNLENHCAKRAYELLNIL